MGESVCWSALVIYGLALRKLRNERSGEPEAQCTAGTNTRNFSGYPFVRIGEHWIHEGVEH